MAVDDRRVMNLVKIGKIKNLQNDWNGYGANPINPKVINYASTLLATLQQEPFICPTARDSIQFEYEKPNGDYLEIEIFDSKIVLYRETGDQSFEKPYKLSDASYTAIAKEVRQFYGQQL